MPGVQVEADETRLLEAIRLRLGHGQFGRNAIEILGLGRVERQLVHVLSRLGEQLLRQPVVGEVLVFEQPLFESGKLPGLAGLSLSLLRKRSAGGADEDVAEAENECDGEDGRFRTPGGWDRIHGAFLRRRGEREDIIKTMGRERKMES